MGVRKNHVLDVLSELHEAVEVFTADLDESAFKYDDGESHGRKEARAVAINWIDSFIEDLNTEKERIIKHYK